MWLVKLAADPNLERSMAICQGIEIYTYPKLYNVKKVSPVQTTLDKFFTRKYFFSNFLN